MTGVVASIAAVALVTGAIYLCKPFVPVLSLGVLYLFAVLPIAVVWGRAYAIPVSIASVGAFNFLFLPPLYTFTLADGENWFALAVYLVTALLVSDLAARARRRTEEAEQRGREEALIAEVSTALLQGEGVSRELERIQPDVARVLRVDTVRIVPGPPREVSTGESPLELRAGDRLVGMLYVREGSEPNLEIRRRFLPALASVVATATDRERLANDAVEAEALRQSDSIKTAVLQAVSHDLRSPLTAIRVAAGGLRSTSLDLSEEDRAVLLDTVQSETERLERLVDDLLDLSRLQAGAAEAAKELWAVDELLGQALAQLGSAGSRIELSLPGEIPLVEVDARQIERVLVNLLENALKFSPADTKVYVRVTQTRREAIVRIVDQGSGVPPGELETIFEPFRRGADPLQSRGTGLGLAIARGFAEANGGRVWAESRPGQGATFALALDAATVPARAGA